MVVEPATAAEIAKCLRDAAAADRRVVVRGNGTKIDWSGTRSDPADLALSTHRLDALLAHRHGDLTATVQSGAQLADVNRELARRGQWIPLDPCSSDRATIGGIVAANDSGPRRQRFGGPRDLIIGIEIVRADGIGAKAGGIVVKNVAGYDLSRLMTGSFGALAVITTATFKLYPLPETSRTVSISFGDAAGLRSLLTALLEGQLTPTAIELQVPPGRLLVRFETTGPAADEQCARLVRVARASGSEPSTWMGDQETAAWSEHGQRPWTGDGAVVKISLLPTEVSAAVESLDRLSAGVEYEIIGRAGLGVLLARVAGDTAHQTSVVNALRAQLTTGRGSVVVLRASTELLARVDRWGEIPGLPLMRALKQQFDPRGILASPSYFADGRP